MTSDQIVHPQVLWAQDKKRLFLTISVESKEPEIKYTDNSLYFKGVGLPENKAYEVTINFSHKIIPDKAVSKNITRCIEFTIPKADENAEYWSSLVSDKKKPAWLKVDFNKWKDEDSGEEDEGGNFNDFGNMDEMLKNLSGSKNSEDKPGFDDSDDDDSDDEIPPVE